MLCAHIGAALDEPLHLGRVALLRRVDELIVEPRHNVGVALLHGLVAGGLAILQKA